MPHQCTACGRTFPDGSKEMLSGCPDCGGNKFQFRPGSAGREDAGTPAGEGVGPASGGPTGASPGATEGNPADSNDSAPDVASDTAASDSTEGTEPAGTTRSKPDASARPDAKANDSRGTNSDSERLAETDAEDTAQASARSDVVSPDELNRASRDVSSPTPSDADDSSTHRPDIDDLRDELNSQFESIRIVSPGKYELNLMELYDRQEYIISLQEDGRYVIEMPDAWGIGDE